MPIFPTGYGTKNSAKPNDKMFIADSTKGDEVASLEFKDLLDWQDWDAVLEGNPTSMTVTNQVIRAARYALLGDTVFFFFSGVGDLGGIANSTVTLNAPMPLAVPQTTPFTGMIIDGGIKPTIAYYSTGTGKINIRKADVTNFTLGVSREFFCSGVYQADITGV